MSRQGNSGENRGTVLPKPRLRGWVHTVMAPLILLAGVGLMVVTPTGEPVRRRDLDAHRVGALWQFGDLSPGAVG